MVLDALVEVILPLRVFLTRPLLPVHVPVLGDGDVEPLHRVNLQVLVLLPHPREGQGVGGSGEIAGGKDGLGAGKGRRSTAEYNRLGM